MQSFSCSCALLHKVDPRLGIPQVCRVPARSSHRVLADIGVARGFSRRSRYTKANQHRPLGTLRPTVSSLCTWFVVGFRLLAPLGLTNSSCQPAASFPFTLSNHKSSAVTSHTLSYILPIDRPACYWQLFLSHRRMHWWKPTATVLSTRCQSRPQ